MPRSHAVSFTSDHRLSAGARRACARSCGKKRGWSGLLRPAFAGTLWMPPSSRVCTGGRQVTSPSNAQLRERCVLVVSRHAHTPGTHPPCMPCGRPSRGGGWGTRIAVDGLGPIAQLAGRGFLCEGEHAREMLKREEVAWVFLDVCIEVSGALGFRFLGTAFALVRTFRARRSRSTLHRASLTEKRFVSRA